MAPREPDEEALTKDPKQSQDKVTKPKKKYGKVRKAEDGLLDVQRTGGRYKALIEANKKSPLLRLPGEIRDQIWQYALGGETYAMTVTSYLRSYVRGDRTVVKASKKQRRSFPLLRTCRQIYREAALLPYKLNVFKFQSRMEIQWFRHLLRVQRDAVQEIEWSTFHARLLSNWTHRYCVDLDFIKSHEFPRFPSIKRALVHVCELYLHDEHIPDEEKLQIEQYEQEIVKLSGDAKVTFKRMHCPECALEL